MTSSKNLDKLKSSLLKTIMTKSIIVAKVPNTYTADQKKEIENSIQFAVKESQILVLPNEVEVFSLPLED